MRNNQNKKIQTKICFIDKCMRISKFYTLVELIWWPCSTGTLKKTDVKKHQRTFHQIDLMWIIRKTICFLKDQCNSLTWVFNFYFLKAHDHLKSVSNARTCLPVCRTYENGEGQGISRTITSSLVMNEMCDMAARYRRHWRMPTGERENDSLWLVIDSR